ncbi:DUF3800 domain-containing protein [Pararhodobacter aggregans]|uniref:DUF3800 domain-containing protein n=1 Tax=Pararhodobacter aggregans TaxID=404875 RepID=UPI003A93AD32
MVDFYFDERSEKEKIRRGWDLYLETKPNMVRSRFGHEPRFEDDTVFLQLQAADLVAGLARTTGRTEQGRAVRDILTTHKKKVIPTIRISSPGEHMMVWLARQLHTNGLPITDGLTGQRLRGADDD